MTCEQLALELLGPPTDRTAFTTASFIALGGDSLLAMRLAAQAEERLGLRLPLSALLGAAPLAQVLAAATAAGAARETLADAADETDSAAGEVSHTQRGMWLVERLTGGAPYNLVFVGRVESGVLDRSALDAALQATVARHPGLRTVFTERDGTVVAEVRPAGDTRVEAVAFDGAADDFGGFVDAVAADGGREPFDLAAGPGLRLLLVGTQAGAQAMILMAHHMVLDGWAVGLFLTELCERYDALVAGGPDPRPGPGVPTSALTRHQAAVRASGAWERQAAFWADHLADVPAVLELPADRPRPALQDPAGARVPLDLGAAVTDAVGARARALGVTPFALLLGAFALTLSRYTGSRRLLVGVPLTGRGTAALADLVAVTGNLVPVRVDVDQDASAATYLRAVQVSLARSIEAGDLPFEELVERLGVPRALGCHPLVQVCFGMHDQLVPRCLRTRTATLRVAEGHGGGAQFDLSLLIGAATPTLAGQVEYATGVWKPAEVAGFVADLQEAVRELCVPGEARLSDVRCIAPPRRALLDRVHGTAAPAVRIDERFAEVVARHPEAVAVRAGDDALTYAELAAAAAQQARRLRAAGVAPGDRVLVALDRSIAEIVAVLGTVLAGAAYVAVDRGAPAAYLSQVVERARPAAALLPAPAVADFTVAGVIPVAAWSPDSTDLMSADPASGSAGDETVSAPDGDDSRLAYVAFTSGSTGAPKGVAVPHRAVIRLIHDPGYVRLAPGERMLRLSPLAFDASTLEIWGALLNGATLEVHPPHLASPSELGRFLVDRGVTVAWLTAGLFQLVVEYAPASLAGLHTVLTGGDVVPHAQVARLLHRHPGLRVVNGYGPTENTTFTTAHVVDRHADALDGPLPIGTPVRGTGVHVLDAQARLLPPGAVGELFVSGAGLADGYLGDPAETGRRFGRFSPDVPHRLYRTGDLVRLDTAGRLRFLGRLDDQVKVRGFRIELSAVTAAVRAQPSVRDAVVVVTDGASAEKRLVAAVVPNGDGTADPATLRAALAGQLPGYMVPAWWAVVDQIPVTRNGKVDRPELIRLATPAGAPATGGGSPEAAPGETAAAPDTASVVALLREAIGAGTGAEPLAPDSDFFMVGGNSMAAVRLMRLVRQHFGVTVRLRDFLLSPTPAGLRTLVTRAGAVDGAAVITAADTTDQRGDRSVSAGRR